MANGGTLSIGGSGTVAATAMTGALVQTTTGRLVVDTDHRTGASDRLDVQGAVRLGGTVEVHPSSIANRAVTVLTATEGVTLDPALTSTRTHLFRFDAQAAGNSVVVQPRAEFTAQAAALGANQQAVASHLQEVWNSGASLGTGGFDALADISDKGSYSRSLNTLTGQTAGAIAAFRHNASQNFVGSMLDDCPTYGAAGLSQEQSTCVWSRAFGSSTDQGSTGGALGYRANAFTLQAGGQRQVAPDLFLGGALSYETSEFRGDAGTSKVTGDSLTLGATLRYQTGPWQFSGALDAGYGWYDSTRTIEVGSYRATAKASPEAWHAGAHARAAYQFAFFGAPGAVVESWYVQPRVDLHLNYVRSGSYTETGSSPFNLAVQGEGAKTFAAVPAVEIGGRVRVGEGMVLRPFASAGVSLNANSDWAATARFAGQPNSRGFRASTPIPDVLAKVTAGAELLTGANWDLRVQYSGEFGDRYTSHTGMARIAYRF